MTRALVSTPIAAHVCSALRGTARRTNPDARTTISLTPLAFAACTEFGIPPNIGKRGQKRPPFHVLTQGTYLF